MTITLQDSIPVQTTDAPMVPGADLARWIQSAINGHGACRTLAPAERDALAQDVALVVLQAGRNLPRAGCPCGAPARWRWTVTDDHGTATDVHRCDAHKVPPARARVRPLLDAPSVRTVLDGRAPYERRAYLRRAVATALARKTWQDHAARYLTASERQRDTGPMVTPAGGDTDRDENGHGSGLLALALDHDSARMDTGSPLDDDVRALRWEPRLVAAVLADAHDWRPSRTRNVWMALERARTVALADDPVAVLDALATAEGCTLHALQVAATKGAAVLRALPYVALRAAMRDASALARAERAGDWRAPWRVAAGEAVYGLALAHGAWDAGSLHTTRSLPDRAPNVARAAGPWQQLRRQPEPRRPRVDGYVLPVVAPLSDDVARRPLRTAPVLPDGGYVPFILPAVVQRAPMPVQTRPAARQRPAVPVVRRPTPTRAGRAVWGALLALDGQPARRATAAPVVKTARPLTPYRRAVLAMERPAPRRDPMNGQPVRWMENGGQPVR